MQIEDAQRDVRQTFMGGFPGALVTSALWFVSAAAGTWSTKRLAIQILCIGGAFIFPLTQLLLKGMGRRAALSHGHPFNALAMQIAFTVPLSLPIIGAAALYRVEWFYPAFMVVIGAHYLPFVFLYGMKAYAVLGGVLISGGTWLGMMRPHDFTLGGWVTGALLLVYGFVALAITRAEAPRAPQPAR